MRNKIKKIFTVVFVFLFIFCFNNVYAQDPLIRSDCSEKKDGCQLSDLENIAINATKIILSITGAVALLAFIYGGFLFLISRGNNETVAKGKAAIKGAVIGMLIVFLSFMIITLVFNVLGVEGGSSWWKSDWF